MDLFFGLLESSAAFPTKLPTSRVWMWNAVPPDRSFQVVCPTKLTWTLKIMLAYGFPKLESLVSGGPPFFSSQGQLYLQEWYFWFQVALPKRNGLVKLRGWALWNAIGCYSLRCTYFCGKMVVWARRLPNIALSHVKSGISFEVNCWDELTTPWVIVFDG